MKKAQKTKWHRGFGAGEQIRTAYLFITNEVLYLLSYTSTLHATNDIITNRPQECNPFYRSFHYIFVELRKTARSPEYRVIDTGYA